MRTRDDLSIRNARLTIDGDPVDIGIVDGRIVSLTASAVGVGATGPNVLDAEGRLALPGAIDPHIHLGNGPHSVYDDLVTETRMAVAGGVTTIFPFLISPDSYTELMDGLADAVSENSLVDVFPQLGIVGSEQIGQVAELHRRYGVRGFKCFMGYKGTDASPSGIRGIDDATILELMTLVARIPGGRLTVHPENMEIVDAARTRVEAADPAGSLPSWNRARPAIAETEAIGRALAFARATGCPIAIPHISVGSDVAVLRAQAAGVDVVFETCPHFTTFSCEDELGTWGKVNPPLRTPAERDDLAAAIRRGEIDTLGSDHCPFDAPTKEIDKGIWGARAGIPNGSAVILPAALQLLADDPDPEAVVRLTSRNAAGRYGIPGKGRIALGADADIALIDLGVPEPFDSARLGGVATASPYDGRSFTDSVWATIARGAVVYADGTARTPDGHARLVGLDAATGGAEGGALG
ncbi:dihydroorotase family protein [Microbacterium soli]|uniref:Amidohydrolase family protein n=1 Tax=Microbacterium soli TaxID=446075 RepID=A0ABP7N3T0_9MICO